MNDERKINFIRGFRVGMVLGIILSLILFLLTGTGGRAPAPEKNPASSGVSHPRAEWEIDTHNNPPSNSGRSEWSGLPASSYRTADGCLIGGQPPAADQILSTFSQATLLRPADYAGQADWLDDLIERIWQQESSGRLNPPDGDDGKAVGPLQIHQEALTDVNQRFGLNYALWDMRDIEKAKLVAKLYITMYLDNNLEEISARIFHYGPAGWRGKDVDGYCEKIKIVTENTETTEVKK
jgi:hypothetical protein